MTFIGRQTIIVTLVNRVLYYMMFILMGDGFKGIQYIYIYDVDKTAHTD